jgi:hypothetical protein
VLLAIAVALPFGPIGFLIGIGTLAMGAGTLALAWRPGGVPSKARAATGTATVVLGLAAAAFGLAANPCVADPPIVALVSVLLFEGTLLGSVAVGRALARSGQSILAFLVAGGLALLGFSIAVFRVAIDVFVLC